MRRAGRPPLPPETPRSVLYSPEILAAAVALADHPLRDDLPMRGEARSRSCGSTLTLGLATDREGRIATTGCQAKACAVGQAAASLFVRHANGRGVDDIARHRDRLAAWLAGEHPPPDWPEIDLLAPARAYPARHGAILLAWDAALAALAPQPALR